MTLFHSSDYMPHGHCYLWEPGLIWTHVISDGLIGLAYLSISITLYALVRKIRLPFSPIFVAFGIFIGACGLTHFMEIWTLWYPDYWLSAMIKIITAVASVITAIVLFPVRLKVIALAQTARVSEDRRLKLEDANSELARVYETVRESEFLKTQFFVDISNQLRSSIASTLSTEQSKALIAQVDDLLDISKLDVGVSPEELRERAASLLSIQRTREILRSEVDTKSDDIEVLVRELAEQKNQAERANRVKSLFLSLVSHELNTPFAAMHLSVEMLEQELPDLNNRQRTLVSHLTNASKQLKTLIESLLEYVRGGNVLHFETFKLKDFVQKTMEEVRSVAERKNLQLRTSGYDEIEIRTDPRKLRIVLNNLLVNAVKFTEKGFVEVSLNEDSSHYQIAVKDSGLGISDEDKERIFEPFEQVESITRKTTPGVGLGLALVRQLVSDLQGEVTLESHKDKGTTFFLRLPKLT